MNAILARKRAKAEAARAGVDYALQEANLRVRHARINEQQQLAAAQAAGERAELEADLSILEQRKLAAMAEAEVRVLQSVDDNSGSSCDILRDLPIADPVKCTELYVSDHLHKVEQNDVHVRNNLKNADHSDLVTPLVNPTMTPLHETSAGITRDNFNLTPSQNHDIKYSDIPESFRATQHSGLNPNAKVYYPARAQFPPRT